MVIFKMIYCSVDVEIRHLFVIKVVNRWEPLEIGNCLDPLLELSPL